MVVEPAASQNTGCSCKLAGKKGDRVRLIYYLESFLRVIMPFRNSCHMPFRKLMPTFTLMNRPGREFKKRKTVKRAEEKLT